MPFPVFDTKEAIPEPFLGAYEEREGKWHPKADDGKEVKEALQKERELRETAEKERKRLEAVHADLERKLAAAETGAEKDEVKKLLEKFDSDLETVKASYEKELADAKAKLRTLQLDDKIKAAALAAGVLPSRVEAVLKLTKENFDLADDRIVVKDEKGQVTTESVADFFSKTYKAQMPELYQGTQAAGGGAAGTTGGIPSDAGAIDVIQNPAAALAAARAAGKTE